MVGVTSLDKKIKTARTCKTVCVGGSLKVYNQIVSMPEYLLAALASALLGWGAYTHRRSDVAIQKAQEALDSVDRVELKVAEHYVTKNEFIATVDRLTHTLERLENKLDRLIS